MNSRIVILLLPTCLGSAWVPASAQNSLNVPMEVVRVSNPNLVPERRADGDIEASERDAMRRGDATLFRIHPQYTLQMVNAASRTELTLGGLIEHSSDTRLSANRNLPSVGVLWESNGPTQVIGLRASLAEESTREVEFTDFGRVALDSTQRTGSIGATWTAELTPSTDLELALSHARVKYDTPLLRDYGETGASARYRWQYGANSRYELTASTTRQRRDEGVGIGYGGDEGRNRISRHGVVLGYELELSEAVTLAASAGAMRTGSPDSRTHAVGGLRLAREGERVAYTLEWARDLSADGTTRGYTRADTFGVSFSYPITRNTTFAVGAGHARSLDGERDEGSLVYARIRSELTPFWAATAGLEHRRARSSGALSARGYAVILGLVYTHPDF